jgi:hypothetical protein
MPCRIGEAEASRVVRGEGLSKTDFGRLRRDTPVALREALAVLGSLLQKKALCLILKEGSKTVRS